LVSDRDAANEDGEKQNLLEQIEELKAKTKEQSEELLTITSDRDAAKEELQRATEDSKKQIEELKAKIEKQSEELSRMASDADADKEDSERQSLLEQIEELKAKLREQSEKLSAITSDRDAAKEELEALKRSEEKAIEEKKVSFISLQESLNPFTESKVQLI
jgi:chromosome segregation ATPase